MGLLISDLDQYLKVTGNHLESFLFFDDSHSRYALHGRILEGGSSPVDVTYISRSQAVVTMNYFLLITIWLFHDVYLYLKSYILVHHLKEYLGSLLTWTSLSWMGS